MGKFSDTLPAAKAVSLTGTAGAAAALSQSDGSGVVLPVGAGDAERTRTGEPQRLHRWKALCAYDGSALSGWQSQPGGGTVQDFIEARLAQIFGVPVRIHGSGRTDAGVHAKAQVFHFDAHWPHSEQALLRALHCGVPASVQVTAVRRVPATFHARFSATGKCYSYHWFEGRALPWESPYCLSLGNRRLDVEAMNAAARPLLGRHDFTAFGANRGDDSVESPEKTLYRLDIRRKGARIALVTEGSGYLYKMVRTLAGALEQVGLGKIPPERLTEILRSGVRPMNLPTAPARGLWMERVYYGRQKRFDAIAAEWDKPD